MEKQPTKGGGKYGELQIMDNIRCVLRGCGTFACKHYSAGNVAQCPKAAGNSTPDSQAEQQP